MRERARSVKLIAMDVDGVLTAGEIIVLESGEEVKFWNAKDRFAMALIRDHGRPVSFAWLTGRSSRAVAYAAQDLGVSDVVQKCKDKLKALQAILKKRRFSLSEAAFIGDDLIDLPVLKCVGFAACPSDATGDVKRNVHYVSPFMGGKGVVRDVIEFVLQSQNKWSPLVKLFL